MARQSLTLLQRSVIQRLRETGYPSIADGARETWTRGERCQLPVHSLHPQLLADYEKAEVRALSWSPGRVLRHAVLRSVSLS
jgi:hypothetical protein